MKTLSNTSKKFSALSTSAVVAFFIVLLVFLSPANRADSRSTSVSDLKLAHEYNPSDVLGKPIMPHLKNETAKAELGRATWKFLHTVLARFPEKPTEDERNTLNSFIHIFSRVYPCGDCAVHFQALLKKYPPQTSSKKNAVQWGCYVHNKVNERLGKNIFDCTNIEELYDCGCGDSEEGDESAGTASPSRRDSDVDIDVDEEETRQHLQDVNVSSQHWVSG